MRKISFGTLLICTLVLTGCAGHGSAGLHAELFGLTKEALTVPTMVAKTGKDVVWGINEGLSGNSESRTVRSGTYEQSSPTTAYSTSPTIYYTAPPIFPPSWFVWSPIDGWYIRNDLIVFISSSGQHRGFFFAGARNFNRGNVVVNNIRNIGQNTANNRGGSPGADDRGRNRGNNVQPGVDDRGRNRGNNGQPAVDDNNRNRGNNGQNVVDDRNRNRGGQRIITAPRTVQRTVVPRTAQPVRQLGYNTR